MVTLSVGTVIGSPDFAYGIETEATFLNNPTKVVLIDRELGLHSISRMLGFYVIEQITMEGGSERDFVPEELFIIARKLHPDKTYNENGDLIAFYYGEHRGHRPYITTFGRMQRIFI